ncbi:MAG: hypothetical protein P4L62_00305 [Candidatus Pacebacteria bacterium]|nr:hypothetical protein [Candidatus Paceibacterota bacterium]MDR3582791.1 hypothetical protein [Candidatus Paceibacterota bacterium]
MAENQKEVNKNRVSWADQYWPGNGGYLKRKQAQKEAREYDRQHPSFSDQYNPAFSRSHRKEAQKQASENEPLPTSVGYAAGKKYQQDMERQQALSKVRNEASRLKTTGAKKSEQKKAAQGVAISKKLAKNINPVGALSLAIRINIFTDWTYGIAMIAAMLKDILDIVEASGVGYMFVVIATFLCTIFIAMMLLLGDMLSGTSNRKQRTALKWLILLIGACVELIPGVDVLPMETLIVFLVYILTLIERKESAQEQKALVA